MVREIFTPPGGPPRVDPPSQEIYGLMGEDNFRLMTPPAKNGWPVSTGCWIRPLRHTISLRRICPVFEIFWRVFRVGWSIRVPNWAINRPNWFPLDGRSPARDDREAPSYVYQRPF